MHQCILNVPLWNDWSKVIYSQVHGSPVLKFLLLQSFYRISATRFAELVICRERVHYIYIYIYIYPFDIVEFLLFARKYFVFLDHVWVLCKTMMEFVTVVYYSWHNYSVYFREYLGKC